MKRIVLDIETNTKHDHIWLVVTKDLDTGEVNVWKQASSLLEYLKDVSLIVGHNVIGFDAPTLNRCWKTKITRKQCWDTLIVSRLLDPSKTNGHSLEAWGEELGTQKIDYKAVWKWLTGYNEKDTHGLEFNDPHMDLLEHYCIRDVEVTERLYHHLQGLVQKHEFSEYSVELEHKVAAIIAKQERNGFKLDIPKAIALVADLQGKVDGIYQAMQDRWPPYEVARVSEKTGKQLKPMLVTFNPGSRQQIAEKLKELGWKPKKHTDKGSIIVDEAVLDEIIKECDDQ